MQNTKKIKAIVIYGLVCVFFSIITGLFFQVSFIMLLIRAFMFFVVGAIFFGVILTIVPIIFRGININFDTNNSDNNAHSHTNNFGNDQMNSNDGNKNKVGSQVNMVLNEAEEDEEFDISSYQNTDSQSNNQTQYSSNSIPQSNNDEFQFLSENNTIAVPNKVNNNFDSNNDTHNKQEKEDGFTSLLDSTLKNNNDSITEDLDKVDNIPEKRSELSFSDLDSVENIGIHKYTNPAERSDTSEQKTSISHVKISNYNNAAYSEKEGVNVASTQGQVNSGNLDINTFLDNRSKIGSTSTLKNRENSLNNPNRDDSNGHNQNSHTMENTANNFSFKSSSDFTPKTDTYIQLGKKNKKLEDDPFYHDDDKFNKEIKKTQKIFDNNPKQIVGAVASWLKNDDNSK